MIISEMQNKLAIWAAENKERKFERLLRLISNRLWLQEAARITLASSGAKTPGIDGVDKARMEGSLHQQLEQIREQLLNASTSQKPTAN